MVTVGKFSQAWLEHWPQALHAFSIASVDLPLTRSELQVLGSHSRFQGFRFNETPLPISDLRQRIDEALRDFPGGAFLRLGSVSAKDAEHVRLHGSRITSGYGAIHMLSGSRRIAVDLHQAWDSGYEPHLFLRKWLAIQPQTEWRCFIEAGKLVGMSQYYVERYDWDAFDAGGQIKQTLVDFYQRVKAHLPLDTLTLDVLYGPQDEQPTLLEINPLTAHTGYCLFSGPHALFDGSLRIMDQTGKVHAY